MKMTSVKPITTEWAAVLPFCNRVFNKRELNDCCKKRGIWQSDALSASISMMDILDNVRSPSIPREVYFRFQSRPADEIAGFILEHLNRPLGIHMENLHTLLCIIEESHLKDAGVSVRYLRAIFDAFREELEAHLASEENILFPWIGRASGAPRRDFIQTLVAQHDALRRKIKAVYLCAGQVTQSADECDGCRALFAVLNRVETILFDHIRFEDRLLFPRLGAMTV